MATAKRYSVEVREQPVRLVLEQQAGHGSQWASILPASAKIRCAAQSLHRWVTQAERDLGKRAGLSSTERDRLKDLERENREFKRSNEILHSASAFFAQAEIAADGKPRGTVIAADGRTAHVSDQANSQPVSVDLVAHWAIASIESGESPGGIGISSASH